MMNKIKQVLQSRKVPVLNIYFTAGFPHIDATGPLIKQLSKNGADLIEIGMPYSDPMADGPTIQQSSSRALENGMTMDVLFDQVATVSEGVKSPLILMGYLNQMMQYGEDRFLAKCKETGISGLIIPDLPPELYKDQYKQLFHKHGIEIIFLITPQTSEDRIRTIDELSDSFIYVVSDSSITGRTKDISDEQIAYFQRIQRMNLMNPTLIGFGISDHSSFKKAVRYSAGAIIGSAFIKWIENKYDKVGPQKAVELFINNIKKGS